MAHKLVFGFRCKSVTLQVWSDHGYFFVGDFGIEMRQDSVWELLAEKILLGKAVKKCTWLGVRQNISLSPLINVCGSADGTRLPPFILFKGKHLYSTWTEGGPAGACYGVSLSGWMEEANFFKWFDKQFYPAVKHLIKTGPVVMFLLGIIHISVLP